LNPFATVENTLLETIRASTPGLPISEKKRYAAALLERVGLPAATGGLMPRELSHAQPERVALARALSVKPRLILIDDTLRALDLRQQRDFVNLLISLREEQGLSYLFATHDFNLLMLLADHVLVMSRGKILESSPISEIVADPQHEFTKKLLASTMTLT
jgi:peptide/nickel transport system ATP-binding protein